MSLTENTSYSPKSVETKLYKEWEESGLFQPGLDGEPYCIALPPPNVTGNLHMGHAFQDTLMDILIRYKRMSGFKALWQGGTDHAGIATQIVVERQLEARGKSRKEIGREAFIETVWDWKRKSGGTISNQLRRVGSSIDWTRERFTLDEDLSFAVRKAFVTLYQEGLIYRGKRLVNWDPVLKTAVSDLEVISEMENGYLWHFKYPLKSSSEHIAIATTRPETMLGDTAIAVNPNDTRYRQLIGKIVVLPLCNREIPIIGDDHVDTDFGSGCLKVTPAHDFNDYEIGLRHNLEAINILEEDGRLNTSVPARFIGLDRLEARQLVISEMNEANLLIKRDNHQLMVPRGDRSGTIIEPFLTDQWFVNTKPLAKPAIDAVKSGAIKFIPENWSKTYFEWLENIQDWCISRQLWWGHRIPAWYDKESRVFVGLNEEEVRIQNNIPAEVSLYQDEDVLDTWFSSALWPFSTLGWPKKTEELSTFYPTNVLVTGFDIIFFWVARMIMMGLKIMGDVPFREVYIHGLVRDSEGRKMSKSKGNIIDPIDLIDGINLEDLIKKRTTNLMRPEDAHSIAKTTKIDFPDGIPAFGTDALRLTFAAMATHGRDIRFDLGRIGGYRNFCNKIWNASRFVVLATEKYGITKDTLKNEEWSVAENWIAIRLCETLETLKKNFEAYRFDLASTAIYEFVWDDFCDWYIESAKATLYDNRESEKRKQAVSTMLLNVMQTSLAALHPIMPFISEELWRELENSRTTENRRFSDIKFPHSIELNGNQKEYAQYESIKKFVLEVRKIRASYNVSPKQEVTVHVYSDAAESTHYIRNYRNILMSLGKINTIEESSKGELSKVATGIVDNITIYIPLDDLIDLKDEKNRLKKKLKRLFELESQLANRMEDKEFTSKAPKAVVLGKKTKLDETKLAINRIENQINNLQ